MDDFPDNQGEYGDGLRRVVELIGDDLLVRDAWGEYYDEDDFEARDLLLLEAEMLIDRLDEADDEIERLSATRELERIKRFGVALNKLQAAALFMEEHPGESLLYSEQIPFFRSICDFLEADIAARNGGHAVIPTGVGKTVIFNEVIRRSGLKTLVVADTNEQVMQNHGSLLEHANGQKLDAGIVDKDHKKIGHDATYTTYNSLLAEMRKPPGQRLINPEEYDMIIFDEAHLVLGENRRTVLRHFDQAIKMAFTATDRYTDDKQVSVLMPHEIVRMTLEEAEDKKLVAPHHNIIVETNIDMRNVPVASRGDYAEDILFESINTDERNLVAVETYMQLHYGKKTIDFCGGVQHAKDLAKMYNDHGIPAAAVWGDMPDEERRKILTAFREGKLLHLTNANLVTTGFDMKTVECAYMLRPSMSELLVSQIGGRSNRLCSDILGKVSYVVQFIDDIYSQPPVLFAEPGVAASAQHGWEGFVFPDIDVGDLQYKVIHDPIEVEFLAMQHFENRRRRSMPPPQGWASYSDLKALSGRPMTHIKKAFDEFKKKQQEHREEYLQADVEPSEGLILDIDMHSGRFMNPETDAASKKYFSPELVHRIAEHLEQYRVRPSVEWRRRSEIGEIYGRSSSWVDHYLLRGVNDEPEMLIYRDKMVDTPTSTGKVDHFHYELVKAGEERNKTGIEPRDMVVPPDHMKSEAELMDYFDQKFGEGIFELAMSRSYERRLGWGNSAGSVVYEVDGEMVHYYSEKAQDRLIRTIIPTNDLMPLNNLLNQLELSAIGVTSAKVQKEAESLLAKDAKLSWKLGLYYNRTTGGMEYFGRGEIHAHIYERLIRKHKADKSHDDVVKALEASPVLSRDYVTESSSEPDADANSEVQKAPKASKSKFDPNDRQETLARAKRAMQQFRQMRQ